MSELFHRKEAALGSLNSWWEGERNKAQKDRRLARLVRKKSGIRNKFGVPSGTTEYMRLWKRADRLKRNSRMSRRIA